MDGARRMAAQILLKLGRKEYFEFLRLLTDERETMIAELEAHARIARQQAGETTSGR